MSLLPFVGRAEEVDYLSAEVDNAVRIHIETSSRVTEHCAVPFDVARSHPLAHRYQGSFRRDETAADVHPHEAPEQSLIQALGLNGGCGGLEQALFWCFARMDVCGSLISSERTLIPIGKWMGASDIRQDCAMFRHVGGSFDMYANCIVYLCGQVIDLLCAADKWEQRHQNRNPVQSMDAREYTQRWSQLFELLDRWHDHRPEEMKPLLVIPAPPPSNKASTRPFQTLFYGSGPAVSGNQTYHTAALLMLRYKPTYVVFAKKPQSLLWHARHICAISQSNNHHGSWTNSVQPLWIAGQHMSHPSEHRAILEVLARIERETGWATKWRADDLKEYWGVLDD